VALGKMQDTSALLKVSRWVRRVSWVRVSRVSVRVSVRYPQFTRCHTYIRMSPHFRILPITAHVAYEVGDTDLSSLRVCTLPPPIFRLRGCFFSSCVLQSLNFNYLIFC